MANRIRPIDEKVKSVSITLDQINVEAAARGAGVPPSTLHYDLKKVKESLPEVLSNRTPGPKPQKKLAEEAGEASPSGGLLHYGLRFHSRTCYALWEGNEQMSTLMQRDRIRCLARLMFLSLALLLPSCRRQEAAIPTPEPIAEATTERAVSEFKGVTITFACRDYERGAYEELADEFEATNLDIDVQLVSIDEVLDQSPAGGKWPEDTWRRLVATADTVVFWVDPDAAGQGLLRDLSEFIAGDKRFQPEDFYSNMLESFQWSGGTWALPVGADLSLVFYDKDAFNAAGIAYPTLDWTWDDFLAKAQALTEREGEQVTRYGYVQLWGLGLARAYLLDHAGPLLDERIDPPIPRLDRPEVAQAAQWYIDLVRLHQIATYIPPDKGRSEAEWFLDNKRAAMWGDSSARRHRWEQSYDLGLAPYPSDGQDTTYLSMRGYLMSAGTAHPQENWQWLSFLTRQSSVSDDLIPARRSVAEEMGYWDRLDHEVARVYRYALEHSQTPAGRAEVVLDAFGGAVHAVLQEKKELQAALAESQVHANERLIIQIEGERATPVAVATPQPAQPSGLTSTIITFAPFIGYGDFKVAAFRKLAEQFNEAHPDIKAKIRPPTMDNQPSSIAEAAEQVDCFAWFPILESPDDRAAILSLTPLIDADPAFNLDDCYPLFMARFRREGQHWGLPAEGWPRLIYYNKALFDAAGVAYPTLDWTLDDFLVKAKALTKSEGDTKQYGFIPEEFEMSDLMLFVDQQGARLVDESVDPNGFLFDAPATVTAVQWYVNLSRVHGVKPVFRALYSQSEMAIASKGREGLIGDRQAAMWTGYGRTSPYDPWAELETGMAPLPQGSGNTGFAIVLGYFISAETEAPWACWEWLVFLTEQLGPVQGLPARRSLAESLAYRQQVGEEAAAVYLASIERSEGSIFMRSSESREWGSVPFLWFAQAYDAIMWEDVAVDTALAQAQAKADKYQACVVASDGFDDEKIWKECARRVDADLPMQLFE